MDDNRSLPSEREADALLDAALAAYIDVSPREGLENRVLARIEGSAPASRSVFGWQVVCAAFVVIACILLPLAPKHGTKQELRNTAVASRPLSIATLRRPPPLLKRAALRRPEHRPRAHPATDVSRPFQAVPLSRQERLLLRVAAAPQHPLTYLNQPATVSIAPIEISAIEIRPLSQN